jgi:hypothetical protein
MSIWHRLWPIVSDAKGLQELSPFEPLWGCTGMTGTLADSGRTLVALRAFEVGAVVLQEPPVLQWDPREVPADLHGLAVQHGLEAGLAAVLPHFCALAPAARAIVDDMWAPPPAMA